MVRFADQYEDEFVKLVVDEHYKQMQQRRNKDILQTMMAREKEVDVL